MVLPVVEAEEIGAVVVSVLTARSLQDGKVALERNQLRLLRGEFVVVDVDVVDVAGEKTVA
jgi:hypothetical protein